MCFCFCIISPRAKEGVTRITESSHCRKHVLPNFDASVTLKASKVLAGVMPQDNALPALQDLMGDGAAADEPRGVAQELVGSTRGTPSTGAAPTSCVSSAPRWASRRAMRVQSATGFATGTRRRLRAGSSRMWRMAMGAPPASATSATRWSADTPRESGAAVRRLSSCVCGAALCRYTCARGARAVRAPVA